LAERQQLPAEPAIAALSKHTGLLPFIITRSLESGIFWQIENFD